MEDIDDSDGTELIFVPRIVYTPKGTLVPNRDDVFDGEWEYIARWVSCFFRGNDISDQKESETDEEFSERLDELSIKFSLQFLNGKYRLVEHVNASEKVITRLTEMQALRLWARFSLHNNDRMIPLVEKLLDQVASAGQAASAGVDHPSVSAAINDLTVAQEVIFRFLLTVRKRASFDDGLSDLSAWSPRESFDTPSTISIFNRLLTIRTKVQKHGFVFVPNRSGYFYWVARPDQFI